MKAKFKKEYIVYIAALLLALLPLITTKRVVITTLCYTFIFGALASAWNISCGYMGQIAWCHAAFISIGAYTSFILQKFFGISPFLTIPLGVVLSVLFATLIGYGTLKLKGPFFSLTTLAFAEITKALLLYFRGITNGASGLWIAFKKTDFFKLAFADDIPFYYIFLVLLVASFVISKFFIRSKTGKFLTAIKEDDVAASSVGIEVFKVKLTAFQISAAITSVFGTFYAYYLAYIDPNTVCTFDLTIRIALMAIVGGMGNLYGPLVGAFILMPLTQILNINFGDIGGVSQLIYGLILVVVVLYLPGGICSLDKDTIHELKMKFRRKKTVKSTAMKGENN